MNKYFLRIIRLHTLSIKIFVCGMVLSITVLLNQSANAESRTLVVHNNTGATITVIAKSPYTGSTSDRGYYRKEKIPPNTRRSLFHILDFGRNVVIFDAQMVRPPTRQLEKTFIAERGGKKIKEVEIFPKDFGRSVMFDARDGNDTHGSIKKRIPTWSWQKVGTGDCSGHDVASSNGFTPEKGKAVKDRTAVCWDGKYYKNKNSRAWCTYKNIESNRCSGGDNRGVMYKAVVKQ